MCVACSYPNSCALLSESEQSAGGGWQSKLEALSEKCFADKASLPAVLVKVGVCCMIWGLAEWLNDCNAMECIAYSLHDMFTKRPACPSSEQGKAMWLGESMRARR